MTFIYFLVMHIACLNNQEEFARFIIEKVYF